MLAGNDKFKTRNTNCVKIKSNDACSEVCTQCSSLSLCLEWPGPTHPRVHQVRSGLVGVTNAL